MVSLAIAAVHGKTAFPYSTLRQNQVRDQLNFVEQRLLKAELEEHALAQCKEEEWRRRMERAQRRKTVQQRMGRQKREALTSKWRR